MMAKQELEKQLIDGFLSGHNDAYRTINGWMSEVLNRRGWHSTIRAAKDDIRQDVLAILIDSFKNNKYRWKGLKTYVTRVTKFTCLRTYDRRKQVTVSEEHPDTTQAPALDRLISDEEHSTLRRALHELDDRCRKVLVLRFGKGMDHNKMAQALKVPAGTSRQWLKRCLDKLRELARGPGDA